MPEPILFPCGGKGEQACPTEPAVIQGADASTYIIHGAVQIEVIPPPAVEVLTPAEQAEIPPAPEGAPVIHIGQDKIGQE